MTRTKQYYEELIPELVLEVLDSKDDEAAYKAKRNELAKNLYKYLELQKGNKITEEGYELFLVLEDCLKSFNPEKGVFINYFQHSLKQKLNASLSQEIYDKNYRGLSNPQRIKRDLVKFIKLDSRLSHRYEKVERYERIAEKMGIYYKDVQKLAKMRDTHFVNSTIRTDEGEEMNFFDTVTDMSYLIEDQLIEEEDLQEKFYFIEEAFEGLRKDTKPIIGDILTCRVLEAVGCMDEVMGLSFINQDIVDEYVAYGVLPTQKELAKKYGRMEASVSRSYGKFADKLESLALAS